MTSLWKGVLYVLGGLILIGPSTTWAYDEGPVEAGATITGVVRFQGSVSEPHTLLLTKDVKVLGQTVPDERLLVSRQGGIRNVVITIEGIRQGKRWPVLKQRVAYERGRYIPHVLVAREGTKLEIENRDPIFHNTHAFRGDQPIFNLALPLSQWNGAISRTLAEEGVVKLSCNVHGWMNAWVIVLDHPYFAVTGEAGTYAITEIPPGTYTVTAWHEKLGKKETQLTVKAKGNSKVDFTFAQ
ncbi:MAG: carboxypeptidase regulatory-like domain-containing protein [candidate division NC10 bacterium]